MELITEVYDLVKILNQYEKNHFQALSNCNGEAISKDYFLLYQLIEPMRTLDVDTIKINYAHRGKEKQLNNDLNYLEEQLLQSILVSTRHNTVKVKLYKSIQIIEYLVSEEQYKLAAKEVKKSIELCKGEDLLPISLLLYEYKNFCDYYLLGVNTDNTENTLATMVDVSFELYLSKKFLSIGFEFRKSKLRYEKTPSDINLQLLVDDFNAWKKLLKSIQRALTPSESILNSKVQFEYFFILKKYSQSIAVVQEALQIVKEDISTNIHAFWVYLNFTWSGFDASCFASKKIVAKQFMAAVESYLKSKIIKSSPDLQLELQKFMLKMKVQYMFFFKDYMMIDYYAEQLKKDDFNKTDFIINQLSRSKIQLSISFFMLGKIDQAYNQIDSLSQEGKLDTSYDQMMCYYLIKIFFELKNKQFVLCDYTIANWYRYISKHSPRPELDKKIYKEVSLIYKSRSTSSKIQLLQSLDQLMKKYDTVQYVFLLKALYQKDFKV